MADAAKSEAPVQSDIYPTERDDPPTEVTRLLAELHEAREETRTSLINAGVRARHLSRRLRRSDSERTLRAVTGSSPPPPPPDDAR